MIKFKPSKVLETMDEKQIAYSSCFVGRKAQDYDISDEVLIARTHFSFNVGLARLSDIGYSALSEPLLENFIPIKTVEWFWYEDYVASKWEKPIPSNKEKIVLDKIETAEKIRLIEIDTGEKIIAYEPEERLMRIGTYGYNIFSSIAPYMSRKISSLVGSYLTNEILIDAIEVNDIIRKYKDTKIHSIGFLDILNRLETIGVVKKVEGKYIPYVALEYLGDNVKQLVSNNFFNDSLRFVLEWTRKFPGISIERLIRESRKSLFSRPERLLSKIVDELINRQILCCRYVESILRPSTRKTVLYYPWFLANLQKQNPWISENEMLINIIISMSEVWDICENLYEDGNKLLGQLKLLLNALKRSSITRKEINTLGFEINNFYSSLEGLGVISTPLENEVPPEIHKEREKVIKSSYALLKSCYYDDLWYESVPNSQVNEKEISNEIYTASQEVDYLLSKDWKSNFIYKLKDFNHYRG